ncbi:hypothetical protein MtrunA17_Chr8g0369521 [Medicago truncatula]|uniref:Uncharacterized protein n=1 Tax=Medicago truncatula TaxID=3880 RepID=A0A396GQH5_MEDTR|nr:hypothetical protein MtrunA17_Chr8g0369521 [Medicago truncatula]
MDRVLVSLAQLVCKVWVQTSTTIKKNYALSFHPFILACNLKSYFKYMS